MSLNVEDTQGQTIEQAQLAVTRQGDAVRSLKASVKEGKAAKVQGLRLQLLRSVARSCGSARASSLRSSPSRRWRRPMWRPQ